MDADVPTNHVANLQTEDLQAMHTKQSINNVSDITTTSLGNVTTASSSIASTIVAGHLLPAQQEQQTSWSNSYSIPLYSSFGNHLGVYGTGAVDDLLGVREVDRADEFNHGQQSSLLASNFDNPFGLVDSYHTQTEHDKLSPAANLLNRHIPPINNSDRTLFPGSNFKVNLIEQSRLQNQIDCEEANGSSFATTSASVLPTRSYSSVLHSHPSGSSSSMIQQQQTVDRGATIDVLNMFDVPVHDQHQLASEAANPNRTANFNFQSANRQQLQYHHSHQQQPRHLGEYISSMGQQQHYQHLMGPMTVGRFGTIGGASHRQNNHPQQTSNYFQRPSAGHQNSSQSTNQENKPFPAAGNALFKRKNNNNNNNRGPFFSGSPSGAPMIEGSARGGSGAIFSASQTGTRMDIFGPSSSEHCDGEERFSRKVFVGGLPPDIDEEEIKLSFRRFGSLIVDWPHKAESKSYFPPKGYAFLLFQEEASVQALIDACIQEEDKLYLCVSSPTIKDKPVQIRPWRLVDADFVVDSTIALDPRKTVFVGGVPRPLKASELATIMNNLYHNVCYAGIDTDPDLKYPKGAGRVAFSDHQSYIAAINARFVHIRHSEIEKRVEVKPYVLDDQFCDECHGARCNNKFAPFFCANITCLRYYCDNCWSSVHSQSGKEFHKPLVKEGAERPRIGAGASGGGGMGSNRNHIGPSVSSTSAGSNCGLRHSVGGESSSSRSNQYHGFRWQ